MSKKVYLAGPMSFKPFCNFPLFFAYEALLRGRGFEVWSPARNDITKHGEFYLQCPNGTKEEMQAVAPDLCYRTALKDDLNYILDTAEAIAMIPGWEKSKGAVAEHALAVCLGMEVIILEPLQ